MDKISEFLFHREKRVEHQNLLLEEYKGATLVTIRANYPGIEKSNYITDNIVKVIAEEVREILKSRIVLEETYKNLEGAIVHFIFDANNVEVKKAMIFIEENHILGRCVDIDVYYLNENEVVGISRSELGFKGRTCFLCENQAVICTRAQRHNIEDIKEYFENRYYVYIKSLEKRESIAYELSQIALKAMIAEVSTMPSFGLVSPTTKGSHKDMDFYTFIESIFSISPYLLDMAKVGFSYLEPKEIFRRIRDIGKLAEEDMFKVTRGVNTHKGMIFLMGVVITAVANCMYREKPYSSIKEIIKDMVEHILDDFKGIGDKENLTHGEILFLQYGFTGIRGQVKGGLTVIFDHVLPKYLNTNLQGNDLYSNTLLELMASIEDSTIAYRHDIETLKRVQRDALSILQLGGMNTEEGRKKSFELEKSYINKNISPGGAADLLAVTIFLGELSKKYK